MSLLNKATLSRQPSQTTLSTAEAFAAITLIAVAADGYVADAEIQAISTALHRIQLYRSYPGDAMRNMFDGCNQNSLAQKTRGMLQHTHRVTISPRHRVSLNQLLVSTPMFERLMSLVHQQGVDTLLNVAIASLPFDLKETAFAMAVDIVLADGDFTKEEEELLNYLYSALGISKETALKILDGMVVKNQG